MQVTTIQDALKMQPDQAVMAISGVIESIFEQNSGKNSTGPWSLQNLYLADPANRQVKIKVKLKDRDPMPLNFKGRKVYLACVKSQTGWTGVKIKDDEYRGKHTTILSVTPTAEISFPDGQQSANQPEQPARQQQAAAPQSEPDHEPVNEPAPETTTADFKAARDKAWQESVNKTRVAAGQAANCYFIALTAAEYNRTRYETQFGHPLTPDHFQGMASSIFIQLCRDHYNETLPPGHLGKFLPRMEEKAAQ